MAEFYVTLPSNACLDIFPDNTLANYLIKLDRPLRLEGKWVVGLVEIHFPNSWDNINDGEVIIEQDESRSLKILNIKSGRYRTVEDVISALHHCLAGFNMQSSVSIFYDKTENYCYIRIDANDIRIKLSNNLSNILGLEHKTYAFGETKGKRQCDIAEGFTSLYVYTNLVEPQIVGDIQAQLLRIVPIKERSKEPNQVVSFQHVQYLPIINTGTESVEVVIRRDDGRKPSFQSGKVIVSLHFKKIN